MTTPSLHSLAALAAVILLAWALGQWARRRGLAAPPGGRLSVSAACVVDARRRAVLLRCDGREALVLTGPSGDTFLGWVERP